MKRLAPLSLLALACTGTITPPATTPAPGASSSLSCPKLEDLVPPLAKCANNVRLHNPTLFCARGEPLPYDATTQPGGGLRIHLVIPDATIFETSATPMDARCFDGIAVTIHITFGVDYTALQGTEPVGTTTSPCIVRSKAVFTSFSTTDPLVDIGFVTNIVKDLLHGALDDAVMTSVFGKGGRCARWTPLP